MGLDALGAPSVAVRWHPYLVDPMIPGEGVPMAEYLALELQDGAVDGQSSIPEGA